MESAATESVDLGKDSKFLGSQNFSRSSNHRLWGVEHSALDRMVMVGHVEVKLACGSC